MGISRRDQNVVSLWYNVAGVGHDKILFHLSKYRVQRHMHTQCFLYGVVDERHFLQIFVRKISELFSGLVENRKDLVVQVLLNFRFFRQMQKEPGRRSCAGVLSTH
ncbi:hypothetical protein METSCH_E04860 [Metschnikowia aff. pulcherrima]|uniref:Uncharacterized protein n=1 Tax=Metschnikowia aff. pulcherrima TaxID=2163413 RepID=A0A4V1AES6_9ASCO|nr:hypothetical protein METSCH_E04860 [Metschnikowia aff. pulcherrima]